MKLSPGSILTGALLGGLCIGIWMAGRDSERAKAWHAERKVMERAIVALGKAQRQADRVYVVDSTAFRVYATRYKRLRDSLAGSPKGTPEPALSDSSPIGNPPALLALCDSTVTLAETALASCAARVRAGDSLLAATRARLAHQQRKPGARRFPSVMLGGFVTPQGEVRLGLGVGVRLW